MPFHNRFRKTLACAGAALAIASSCNASETLAEWNFGKAIADQGTVTVPYDAGTLGELKTGKIKGINVEKDASAPGGQALVFSGDQEDSLKSTTRVDWPEGREVAIDLQVKPSTAASSPGYIMRLWGSFGVRFIPPETIQFVVFDTLKGFTILSRKANASEWNKVHAQVKNGVAELTVNGETAHQNLPEGSKIASCHGHLAVGGYTDNLLCGAVGSLKIVADP